MRIWQREKKTPRQRELIEAKKWERIMDQQMNLFKEEEYSIMKTGIDKEIDDAKIAWDKMASDYRELEETIRLFCIRYKGKTKEITFHNVQSLLEAFCTRNNVRYYTAHTILMNLTMHNYKEEN